MESHGRAPTSGNTHANPVGVPMYGRIAALIIVFFPGIRTRWRNSVGDRLGGVLPPGGSCACEVHRGPVRSDSPRSDHRRFEYPRCAAGSRPRSPGGRARSKHRRLSVLPLRASSPIGSELESPGVMVGVPGKKSIVNKVCWMRKRNCRTVEAMDDAPLPDTEWSPHRLRAWRAISLLFLAAMFLDFALDHASRAQADDWITKAVSSAPSSRHERWLKANAVSRMASAAEEAEAEPEFRHASGFDESDADQARESTIGVSTQRPLRPRYSRCLPGFMRSTWATIAVL